MKTIHLLPLLLLFLSVFTCAQPQRSMETITPHSRPADELLPIIQAYIKPPSSIRLYHNTIILNATDTEHQQITYLLNELDTPATDLLFTIKSHTQTGKSQQQAAIKTSAHGTTTTLTFRQNNQSLGQQGEQHIRASEGQAAYCQFAQQAFYVTARLNDDQVHLQLNQAGHNSGGHQSGHNSSLQLNTQTSGTLGQWILIGQLQQQGSQYQQAILTQKNNNQGSNSAVYIKINKL